MPISLYFDKVFGVDGDLTPVPDLPPGDGSVNYDQGFPIAYSTPVGSGGLNIGRGQTNQILNDITAAIQQLQQNGIPPFITTVMNGGTPYSYAKYATVLKSGVAYISLVAANTDTPPSAKWRALNSRIVLVANQNYYVSPTGDDSHDGLTLGTAWLTLQHAWDFIIQNLDLGGQYSVTVNVADGTYAGVVNAQGRVSGTTSPGSIIFLGNLGTPGNVVVNSASANNFSASWGSGFRVRGMQLITTGSATNCLFANDGGAIQFDTIDFGACPSNTHIHAGINSIIQATGNYSISGGAAGHINSSSSGGLVAIDGETITLTGTPAFASYFAGAAQNANVTAVGCTFTGSATGPRYSASENAVIHTGGGGGTYFPGNAGGTTATGGQYT